MNHINFIVTVEMELGMKFKVAGVRLFENVGAIMTQDQSATRLAALYRTYPQSSASAAERR